MDNETAWAIYFQGICAMQFHPRNQIPEDKTIGDVIAEASLVADMMLSQHRRRYQCQPSGEQ